MTKTERTAIRMTPELKKRLQDHAEKDRRSFSDFCAIVLENHIDQIEKNTRQRNG